MKKIPEFYITEWEGNVIEVCKNQAICGEPRAVAIYSNHSDKKHKMLTKIVIKIYSFSQFALSATCQSHLGQLSTTILSLLFS